MSHTTTMEAASADARVWLACQRRCQGPARRLAIVQPAVQCPDCGGLLDPVIDVEAVAVDGPRLRALFEQRRARPRDALDRSGEPVMSALFEARAARMLDDKSREWSRGLLSGLLIGAEIASLAAGDEEIVLIGEDALAGLYERALSRSGRTTRMLDAEDAVIAGLQLAHDTVRQAKDIA